MCRFLAFILVSLAMTASLWGAGTDSAKLDPASLPAEQFLAWVRLQPVQENWALLKGEIAHRRAGQTPLRLSISLAMRATPSRVLSQLILADSEMYTVSQAFSAAEGSTSVMASMTDSAAKLALFGVKPEDLTFSFLYSKLLKEEPGETISLQKCRVLLLDLPKEKETVKVWISVTYGMPIRVQWFKAGDPKYYRSLEIEGVTQLDNELYVVSELGLSGKGWRTSIHFTDRKAGKVADGVPTDLFQKNVKSPSNP